MNLRTLAASLALLLPGGVAFSVPVEHVRLELNQCDPGRIPATISVTGIGSKVKRRPAYLHDDGAWWIELESPAAMTSLSPSPDLDQYGYAADLTARRVTPQGWGEFRFDCREVRSILAFSQSKPQLRFTYRVDDAEPEERMTNTVISGLDRGANLSVEIAVPGCREPVSRTYVVRLLERGDEEVRLGEAMASCVSGESTTQTTVSNEKSLKLLLARRQFQGNFERFILSIEPYSTERR